MQVELCNVTKEIKGNVVLDDISIAFRSGMVTGIRGINGSGKTMLLRTIAGLIKPTKGNVFIDNKELWKDISFPESIGLLIENPAFLDHFTAFQNCKMLAELNERIGDDEICNILHKVALDPKSSKKYKMFSLGMKQRLGIAAAVMEHPDIILLDEPTNALDSDGIEMFKDILYEEKKRGALIVLTCHDYDILQELSDEIYFMNNGKISYSPEKE